MSDYASIKALHATLPPFAPMVPTALLPYIAFFSLLGSFVLAFLFSTLPKSRNPVPELATAAVASLLAGAGIVALFCTVGVYV
ncbi:hypothetical protein Q5752_004129 [Cryptotrichosporon argae]